MKTRKNPRANPAVQPTFREKLAYRLDHPRFIATDAQLKAEAHRYDFGPKRPPTDEP
jgi:hypothetical protein